MDKIRVLAIDDEPDFLDYLLAIVESVGFACEALCHSSEIENLNLTGIDIVILDLFMPDMDGIEVLRLLNAKQSSASLVFVSGKDKSILQSAQKLALEMRFEVLGILQKPFLVDDLTQLLAKYNKTSVEPAQTGSLQPITFSPSDTDIEKALAEDEFSLVFQPQINLNSLQLIGAEVLLRWNHPKYGFVPPDVFIKKAEESQLIYQVTDYVNHRALVQLSQWHKQGLDLRLSLNISSKVLSDHDLPQRLYAETQTLGLPPNKIMLEITETAITKDVRVFMETLTRLKMKNFLLSLDDFGTGYSFLSQLVRIPFNELKIDLTFVRNYFASPEYKTIADITIILAHRLGMQVVAEGIEDRKTLDALIAVGCNEGQGYYFAKPMRADDFVIWQSQWSAKL